VLTSAGEEPSGVRADMTQENRTLSRMLAVDREVLEQVFGPAFVLEIEMAFDVKPPGLRHAMGHGNITAGDCFSEEVIFGCWLLYQLTCLPLAESWEDELAPEIQASWRD
jgi:hypothetical protein